MRKFKVKVNGKEYEVEIEEIKTEQPAEIKEEKKEESKEENK